MKRKPSRFALAVVALLCVVSLVACCSSSTPILRYLTVAPTTATIDTGTTQQFSATGYYSNGAKIDVTSTAGWTSSNLPVATVLGGVATGVSNGTATITATLLGASASATLNVNRTLQSITISTETSSVALGLTAQYTATGTFLNADGTTGTADITSLATWSSSDLTIATIAAGTATTLKVGTTNISASLDGITSANSVLTVTAAVANGLQVTPATASLAIGNSVAFVALELKTDGTTQPLTGTVSWAESGCTPAGAVLLAATATNGTETGSGFAVGSCTVTATEGTFTGKSTVTVAVGSTHFAYVANTADTPDGSIGGYAVTASSATPLTPLSPATTPTTQLPQQVVLHPNGQFLYSIDQNSKVHVYDVNSSTGALTLVTPEPSPLPSGGAANTNVGVVDPTGRYLYVIDDIADTVDSFVISQVDGSLGPVRTFNDPSFNGLSSIVIDHTGQYLFVTNENNGSISACKISQTDGTLTFLVRYATGSTPLSATIDPTNKKLYVANSGDNTVSLFALNNGSLTLIGVAVSVSGASAISNLVVDPTSSFLYVLDSGPVSGNGAIYGFTINSTGAITGPITGFPVPTGGTPFGIVIDPTGTLVAAENNFSNTISLFAAGTGGKLTPDTPPTVATGKQPLYVVFYNAAP